jgi:hypothetical protein
MAGRLRSDVSSARIAMLAAAASVLMFGGMFSTITVCPSSLIVIFAWSLSSVGWPAASASTALPPAGPRRTASERAGQFPNLTPFIDK